MRVYAHAMRRIQLYIDDALNHALSAEAARLGRSRSEVMRHAARTWLGERAEAGSDPVDALVASVDIDPDDDLDAVIYGS